MVRLPTRDTARRDATDTVNQAEPRGGDAVQMAATLVSAAIVIAALYYGRDILIPLVFAFLIGFALNPPVVWLRRHGLPKILSIVIVMTVVLVFLASLAFVLGAQVRSLSEQLPTYQSTIKSKLVDLRTQLKAPGVFEGALKTVETVQKEVEATPDSAAISIAPQKVELVPPPGSQLQVALLWLGRALEPLATAGIVFVFVVLALLDRADMRDRLLRLMGGNLHRSTDAIGDAGKRISKYLLMQLIVNVTYGIPLTLGLWLIGVPGALLWGVVAAVMRFVPYVGPMISAVFPLALAFAVDPGWGMAIWTLALIVTLELISNNIVEPMLYGTSTGLSAMSLIAAATFWTALWGPVGLILSTPLTVCLLVIGKNLPQLKFLDTLLGSVPVLSPAMRAYQRLLANDVDEVIEIADAEVTKSSVTSFYDSVGIEVLRLASDDYSRNATAEHRLRVADGMDVLLEDLRADHPAEPLGDGSARVVCIGGKWEIDAIAAEMLAHALALEGISAANRTMALVTTNAVTKLELDRVSVVCLSYFSGEPNAAARQFCRRLRQRWPQLKIILALWNLPADALSAVSSADLGADEVATSIAEAIGRIQRMLPDAANDSVKARTPENDSERVAALHQSDFLNVGIREDLDVIAKRASDVFDVGFAMISAIDATQEIIIGRSKDLPGFARDDADRPVLPRVSAICDHVVADGETLVVADTKRDPRFTDNPVVKTWDIRFYAGVPLRSADGFVLGALCILDADSRTLDERELELLQKLAADVVEIITRPETGNSAPQLPEGRAEATATIGQKVPE